MLVSQGIEIDSEISELERVSFQCNSKEQLSLLQSVIARQTYIRDTLLFPMSAEEKLEYERLRAEEEEKEADKTWEFLKAQFRANAHRIKTNK